MVVLINDKVISIDPMILYQRLLLTLFLSLLFMSEGMRKTTKLHLYDKFKSSDTKIRKGQYMS